MSIFSKLIGKNKAGQNQGALGTKQTRDPARYDVEKEKARSDKAKDRLSIAKDPKTHLEILYYLADDQDVKVRRAVAKNPSTPLHVSETLAKDGDLDVKMALIARLSSLLPDLSQDQYAHLYAFAAQALGILALDEVLKVRLALSSALRDEAFAPPEVVSQLARDLERQVSEPILKFCSVVPDDVLMDILVQHPDDWVVEAIASRDNLAEDVSYAVIQTQNTKGGEIVIRNDGAKLGRDAINMILALAPSKPEWHKPLALQTHLPPFIMKEIIGFVDKSIQKLIVNRRDLDPILKKDLTETVSRRMNFLVDKKGKRITPDQKLEQLIQNNGLDEDAFKDAVALREYDFVFAGLAHLSGLSLDSVKKMIQTGSAKSTTSVVWKAGLGMKLALDIQKTIAKIQPKEILYPKDGQNFPMSETDMQWQVDFFSE